MSFLCVNSSVSCAQPWPLFAPLSVPGCLETHLRSAASPPLYYSLLGNRGFPPPPDQEHLTPLRCIVFFVCCAPVPAPPAGLPHSSLQNSLCWLQPTARGNSGRLSFCTPGPARPAAQSVKCSLRWSEVELMFNTMRLVMEFRAGSHL